MRTHTRTHMRTHMRNNMKATIVTFGTFRSVLPLQVPESALALEGSLDGVPFRGRLGGRV